MHSVNILRTYREQAAQAISKLEKIYFPVEAAIEAIRADETIAVPQREARIRVERQKVENQIVGLVKTIADIAAAIAAQRRFWSSPALVLAQQKFAEFPSSDAAVKSWHASRLAKLPLPALSLEYEHALATGDFPLLGLILSERAGRTGIAPADLDSSAFSLADVAIPGVAEALGALDGIESDVRYSELLFRSSRGAKIGAAEKMAMARSDPARKPSAQPHAIVTVREDLAETSASRAVQSQPALD